MNDHPKTYEVLAAQQGNADSQKIFEPALKHFAYAFRVGDPAFENAGVREQWYATRREAIDHVVRLIANSRWQDSLVLRGSLVLKSWVGDEAREPGDIDWVFQPTNVTAESSTATDLLGDIQALVKAHARFGDATFQVDNITHDTIWAYDRSPGHRLVFPWTSPGLPAGHVQMDLAFGQELLAPPMVTFIPSPLGGGVKVLSATPELSLAWKLLWLQLDCYPQGKDLYDATLLAERTHLPFELLSKVFVNSELGSSLSLRDDFAKNVWVDWENFQLEYPWVQGTMEDWKQRLGKALVPVFEKRS